VCVCVCVCVGSPNPFITPRYSINLIRLIGASGEGVDQIGHTLGYVRRHLDVAELVRAMSVTLRTKHTSNHELGLRELLTEHTLQSPNRYTIEYIVDERQTEISSNTEGERNEKDQPNSRAQKEWEHPTGQLNIP